MLPNRVSNLEPVALESDALPTASCGPQFGQLNNHLSGEGLFIRCDFRDLLLIYVYSSLHFGFECRIMWFDCFSSYHGLLSYFVIAMLR